MRIALFLILFSCLGLHAQDPNHSAQTAGGEFFHKNSEPPNSITLNGIAICPFDEITKPKDEYIMQLPQTSEIVSSKETNPLVYVGAFLIVGIGVYFVNSKKQNQPFRTGINLESEEEIERRKKLWDAMSQPETE